jgi:hypothetical protein
MLLDREAELLYQLKGIKLSGGDENLQVTAAFIEKHRSIFHPLERLVRIYWRSAGGR